MSLPSYPRAPGSLLPEPDPGNLETMLEAARAAHDRGDPARALQLYESFFDGSADDDTGSYYGVRLSYCLHEWASLGEEHPPAQARLLWKKDECRRLLDDTGEPERFHEYKAICEALGDAGSPVGVFLDLHERDPDLAAAIHRFIDHELVDFGLWSLAAAYLPDPRVAYERAVERFEEAMQVSEENPDVGGEEFADQVRGWVIRDLRDLWLTLSEVGRPDDAREVVRWAAGDDRLTPHPRVLAEAFAPQTPPGPGTTG